MRFFGASAFPEPRNPTNRVVKKSIVRAILFDTSLSLTQPALLREWKSCENQNQKVFLVPLFKIFIE
jgi:hypothetical protein